jgi:predicted phosphate transport protein (TIGR00153 family)
MFKFKQKEDNFFKFLIEAAQNVNDAAVTLRKGLDSGSNKEFDVNRIEELEHKGDQFVGIIIKELNEAFITPIDREDIHLLIKEMDDILDLINSTAHRFMMFNIGESTNEVKLLADMLVDCTKNILGLMEELNTIHNKTNNIKEKIISINEIESKADCLFRETVAELFKHEKDALQIIKWKEIYQILENTIDRCEKVANTVEGVVIKNA